MSGQEQLYDGYVSTSFIREKAGFKAEIRIKDDEINDSIKTAEEYINDDTDLEWYPYPKDSNGVSLGDPANKPPLRIQEVCKFLAVALLRNIYPDPNDTYKKNWDMGILLLEKFKTTNATAQTAGIGETALSDYNADTNNPDIEPDLTSKTFNRDYVPTYF